MKLEDAINIILEELPTPAGQAWVTIEELKDKARDLDDSTSGRDDRLESIS